MSGEQSFSQASSGSIRCRIELTFQVAMRMSDKNFSDRKTGAAAAGCGGIGVDHADRGADQIVDEIDLGTRAEWYRVGNYQPHATFAGRRGHVLGLRALDGQFEL